MYVQKKCVYIYIYIYALDIMCLLICLFPYLLFVSFPQSPDYNSPDHRTQALQYLKLNLRASSGSFFPVNPKP